MKKKILTAFLAVVVMASLCVGTAFATSWFVNNKSENNTVTIGQAIEMSVTAGATSGNTGMIPGGEATFNFTVDLDGQTGYDLKITFDFGEKSYTFDTAQYVWQYDLNGAGYQNLVDATPITLSPATDGAVTLKLKLNSALPTSYAEAEMTFTVELVETAS